MIFFETQDAVRAFAQEPIRPRAANFASTGECWHHRDSFLSALKAGADTCGLASFSIGGGEATAMAFEIV